MSRILTIALLIALTAACATGGEFPSLAPRAVEQLSMEEPIKVDPPVAPDPEVRGRAAALLARVREGDADFEAAYARALPMVRRSGPSGSEAWIEAQEMISRLEVARATSSGALAEIDRYVAERADEPTNEGDHAAMIGALRAAEAIVMDQQRRFVSLRNSLSRP
jgi:hypothetical protein